MKKVIIGICSLVLIAILCVLLFILKNEDKVELITLDINPSIELKIKKEKVISARAINDDALEYVKDLKGKTLNESFDMIISKAKENDLVEEGSITIVLGLNSKNEKVENILKEVCDKKEISADIIVPEITEEAKKEAEAHGISAAKAAYIDEIVKENENITFEDMINKPTKELSVIKETGKYCDPGYTLDGDFCKKPIKEEKAKESKVCPKDYEDIDGKCYLKVEATKEDYCNDGLVLKNGKCVGEEKVDASYKCSVGTYNSKTKKCELLTYISDGSKKCRESEDLLLDNGKCASHHMGAHFGEEGAQIDPKTECCCGDTYKDGWCYSLPNGNYDASVTCPSGSSYENGDKGKACYKKEESDATITCSKGSLNGNKCNIEVSKNPLNKLTCGEGLEMKDQVCIDYSKIGDYIVGYTCDDSSKLNKDVCIYYEVIEAKNK